jgi:hypothetical protein
MRKLGYIALSSLVLSIFVLRLESSHVGAAAPVGRDEQTPAGTGSDTAASGAAEDVPVATGKVDVATGGTGEDRVLDFGFRLERPHDLVAGNGGESQGEGQTGPLEDVLISSAFLPVRRELV